MSQIDPKWLVITWRLGSATSTPRVTTWRTLRRIGAVSLTPGAAVVPYGEDLLEQLDWLAQDITESGGDAWVLPVTKLSERDEEQIRARMREDRRGEYEAVRTEADRAHRANERELATLERRFARVAARDFFSAPGRRRTRDAIEHARRRAAS